MTEQRQPRRASAARRSLFPLAWRAVEQLRLEPAAARYVVPRLRLLEPSVEAFERAETRVEAAAAALAGSREPIVVGPFLSEVGVEVLYWIPFLRRLAHRFELDPSRLVAVSRGGVASWYSGVCDRYVDIFEFLEPHEFRGALEQWWAEQGGQKQFAVGAFDRRLADAAAERLDLGGHELLHPSTMIELFSKYWLQRVPLRKVLPHLEHRPFSAIDGESLVGGLPTEFTAVRFYFRETFPDTPRNRHLVASLVRRLAARGPVVLLDTGLEVDDHSAVPVPDLEAVLRPLVGVAPEDNLGAQSAVLARATSFIGTYGGLCYLANAYGVPAFALVDSPTRKLGLSHTPIARRLSTATGAPLSIVATTALEALAA